MKPSDYIEAWSRATEDLRSSMIARMEMKGKQGYGEADLIYWEALKAYYEATEAMLEAVDGKA